MTNIWVSFFFLNTIFSLSWTFPLDVGPASISAALPARQARAQVISDVQIVSRNTLGWLFRSAALAPQKTCLFPFAHFFSARSVTSHDVSLAAESERNEAERGRSSFSAVSGCNRCTKNNSVGVCYALNANERMGTGWRCDSGGDIECRPRCLLAFWTAGAWFQK